MSESLEERLRRNALALASLATSDADASGVVGFLLGATYSLKQAAEFKFEYGDIDAARYADELRDVSRAIAQWNEPADVDGVRWMPTERSIKGVWLAGYYFDSALHRLAAAAERIGLVPYKSASGPAGLLEVRRDVNKQKHEEAGILLKGRKVTSVEQAVDALEILVRACHAKGILK